MEEQFLVYYCSVCYICKKPAESSESMKFCSGCKLIQYCSIEHQKRDWPNHKEVCKCIQLMMKKMKMGHVYQDASRMSPGDLSTWNALRMSFAKLLELTLKRSLTTPELQMILFPPVCNYCHLYKVNKMFICLVCKSVMYCSKEHQCADKKHNSVCTFFVHSFEVDMLRFHKQTAMFGFLSFVDQCRVKKFPKNMELFIKSITSTLTTKGICLSEPLSFTLTLVYVISKIAKIRANQLTLHIVGADSMELLAMQTFPLIYHLLPHIIHLNIVLIGPKLLDDDSIPLCITDSNLSLSSVKLLYHEYVVSQRFVTPDIIAALNCGFCEFANSPAKDSWEPSLPSVLSVKNTVVTITSYTEKESVSDIQRLRSFKRKDSVCNTIMECSENPFSSLYPHRDWENEGVYFANKYISVMKT